MANWTHFQFYSHFRTPVKVFKKKQARTKRIGKWNTILDTGKSDECMVSDTRKWNPKTEPLIYVAEPSKKNYELPTLVEWGVEMVRKEMG